MEGFHLDTKWEDITCPICLSYPHNSVLLQCTSYNKGCRPFVCDTDHLHSNCLHRFRIATGTLTESTGTLTESTGTLTNKPSCPLCRGDVTGWVVIKEARVKLDEKKRCCEDEKCTFSGTYTELHEHAQTEHPHACPSKVDPARQQDWENFQQSSEIIDVLSTIHSEVPHGVVLGDYVIEYGDNESGDEYEDFPVIAYPGVEQGIEVLADVLPASIIIRFPRGKRKLTGWKTLKKKACNLRRQICAM
ncbi:unnamed protein product [Lactuca virosa]|uniref:RING-type E3 ubiquitin transferase n=1 Tax=Lactuca virosa TaxID=75947 RepID=A0AAU9MLV6_9ASTR|nr:unnamed protein product [Lactuca virosa]